MATTMGLGSVLRNNNTDFKMSFRWKMQIDDVMGDAINILAPLTSSQPSMSFKEIELEHVSETIFMPTKAQWKPIKVRAYDIATNARNNVVFDWMTQFYNSQKASYNFVVNNGKTFKRKVIITHLNGCGCPLSSFILENAYPKDIDFSELDMNNTAVLTVDMELRYDRAYYNVYNNNGNFTTVDSSLSQ